MPLKEEILWKRWMGKALQNCDDAAVSSAILEKFFATMWNFHKNQQFFHQISRLLLPNPPSFWLFLNFKHQTRQKAGKTIAKTRSPPAPQAT
jgi:hypothetical protein